MKLKKTLNLSASLIGACIVLVSVPLFIASCVSEEPIRLSDDLLLPHTPYAYSNADANVATLGRVLFYDKNLSANNSVSCSSCHKQSLAFADDRRLSLGFENVTTRRNSMPIQDLAFNDTLSLFWDGREKHLASMVVRPITDPVEMGITDMDALCEKLESMTDYKILFARAFRDGRVTEERIAQALASFVQSIQAFVFIDTTFTNLHGVALQGAELFVSKYECNSCHQIQDAHGYVQAGTFANIGLESNYVDKGLAEVTLQTSDEGKFRIPSLRNVALTAPYMHDGRFETLEEAIDHYSDGIQAHPNLDERLRNPDGTPKVFSITPAERDAIIAFLNTLTSDHMLSDVRFSDPFRH
jgi:cytochrome c peroxidase